MHVVFNSIYPIKMTVLVSYYTANIGIKLIRMVLVNSRSALFSPEYKMIEKLTIT